MPLKFAAPGAAPTHWADQVTRTSAELGFRCESEAPVDAVMLIPGGLGETRKSREPAAGMAARINAAHARPGGGPIFLGANCLGVVSHPGNYDSWFIPLERLPKPKKKPERNSVMLSQSGALGLAILDHVRTRGLGVSSFVSVGNKADVSSNDLLAYWKDDPRTAVILLYLESFGNPRKFARIAPDVARRKPVIAVKSGRSAAGVRAASSHSASLASLDVAFHMNHRKRGRAMYDPTTRAMREGIGHYHALPVEPAFAIASSGPIRQAGPQLSVRP